MGTIFSIFVWLIVLVVVVYAAKLVIAELPLPGFAKSLAWLILGVLGLLSLLWILGVFAGATAGPGPHILSPVVTRLVA